MTGPLSLLRRQRDRRRSAVACALFALAFPAVGSAGSLQPDPATAPMSAGLQPDAFDHAPPVPATEKPARTPAAAVLPVHDAETLPTPTHARRTPPVTPPVGPKIIPVTKPIAQVAVTAPVTAETLALPRVVHGHAKVRSIRVAVKHHAAARLQLPSVLRGSVTLPAPAAAERRDLVPAALALLAVVATSGCLLAVAARVRREGLEA